MTFHSVGNFIVPTDELIFFRGVGQPPTSCDFILFHVFHVSNWLISSVIPDHFLITSILDVRKVSYASITQLPIGSMYGIYANIWGILMVNLTIYGMHGSYGL